MAPSALTGRVDASPIATALWAVGSARYPLARGSCHSHAHMTARATNSNRP